MEEGSGSQDHGEGIKLNRVEEVTSICGTGFEFALFLFIERCDLPPI